MARARITRADGSTIQAPDVTTIEENTTLLGVTADGNGVEVTRVALDARIAAQTSDKADQSALDAEETARGNADTALGTRVDGVETTANAADARSQTNATNIASERADRMSDDANIGRSLTSLRTDLTQETTDRTGGDDALGTRIDNVREVPTGGTDGQIVTKGTGDVYAWEDAPAGGGGGGALTDSSVEPRHLNADTEGEKGAFRVRLSAASETFAQATRRIVDDANYVPDVGPDTAGQILGNDGTDVDWVDAPSGGGGGGNDGEDGLNQFKIYRRAAGTPSTPSGGNVDDNGDAAVPQFWNTDPSRLAGENPLYLSVASGRPGDAYTWSGPVRISGEDGEDGSGGGGGGALTDDSVEPRHLDADDDADKTAFRNRIDAASQPALTQEITDRETADTALGGRIDTEATARAQGDAAGVAAVGRVRQVSTGGNVGQVLTREGSSYDWADSSGGGVPDDRSIIPVKFDTRDSDGDIDTAKQTALTDELGAVHNDAYFGTRVGIEGWLVEDLTSQATPTLATFDAPGGIVVQGHASDWVEDGDATVRVTLRVRALGDTAPGSRVFYEIGGVEQELTDLPTNSATVVREMSFEGVQRNARDQNLDGSPLQNPIDAADGSGLGYITRLVRGPSNLNFGFAVSFISGHITLDPRNGAIVENEAQTKEYRAVRFKESGVGALTITEEGDDNDEILVSSGPAIPADSSITPRKLASDNAAEQASFRARIAAAPQAELDTEETTRAQGDAANAAAIANIRQVSTGGTDGQVLTADGTGSYLWETPSVTSTDDGSGTVTTTITTTNTNVENFEFGGFTTDPNNQPSSGAGSRFAYMAVSGSNWDFRLATLRVVNSARFSTNLTGNVTFIVRKSSDHGVTFTTIATLQADAGEPFYEFPFAVGANPLDDGDILDVRISAGSVSGIRGVMVMTLAQTIVHSITTAATATAERQYDATFSAVTSASFALETALDTSPLTRSFGTAPDGGELISRSDVGEFRARIAGVYRVHASAIIGIATGSSGNNAEAILELRVQRDGGSYTLFERASSEDLNGAGAREVIDFSTEIGLNENDRIQVRLHDARGVATLEVPTGGTLRIFNSRTE